MYNDNFTTTTRNPEPAPMPSAFESVMRLVNERKELIEQLDAIERQLNEIRKVLGA